MSFLGRLGKIVHGFYGGVEAIPGLAWDLSSASFRDDPELNGFFHTLVGRVTNRGAQVLQNTFGPEGAIGSTIGALAPEIRDPVGSVIHPVLEGSRWAYTNGISHPLSTLIKVGSLSESEQFQNATGEGSWGIFFDPSSWGKAWDMTKHQSPGQALAENLNFAFVPMVTGNKLGGDDVLDRGEVNKFMGTDFYKGASGITDAVLSWEYDPLQFLGHVGGAARRGRVGYLNEGLLARDAALKQAYKAGVPAEEAAMLGEKAAATAHTAQVGRYFHTKRWDQLDGELQRINDLYPDINTRVGAIKAEIFPDHASGHDAAVVLARANTTLEREAAVRVMMGENNATKHLISTNAELAETLRQNFESTGMIHDTLFTPDYHNSPSYRPDVNPGAQIDAAKEAFDVGNRLEGIWKTLDKEPRVPGHWQQAKNSEFYQHSAFTKPVRVFTNIRSTGLIDTADPLHITQVERALREAGMDDIARLEWSGKMANAAPAERMAVVLDAEKAAIQHLADKHGVAPADLKEILGGGNAHRKAAMKLIEDAPEDIKGRKVVQIPGLDEHTEFTARIAAPENAYLMTDMKALDKALSWWSRHGMDGFTRAPREAMESVMKVWRAGVLLRPAWPVRVVGENGMAMMAKLEELSMGVPSLRKTIKDYATWKDGFHNTWHDISEQLGLGWGGGTGALFGGLVAGPFGAAVGGAAGIGGQLLGRSLEEIPYHQFLVNGYAAHVPFGSPLDKEAVWRQLSSGRASIDAALGRQPQDPRLIVSPQIPASRLLTAEERAAAIDQTVAQHLPGGPGDIRRTVLPVIDTGEHPIPGGFLLEPRIRDRIINNDENWTEQTIPINKIVTDQSAIPGEQVAEYMKWKDQNAPPIEAFKIGDHYLLWDGNHRVAQSMFKGESQITARVADYPMSDAQAAIFKAEAEAAIADTPRVSPVPTHKVEYADPADHMAYQPGHSMYPAQWEKAVNEEIAKDPLARVILSHDHGTPIYVPAGFTKADIEGMTGAEVGRLWLQHTAEGRAHVANTPVRSGDLEAWTQTLSDSAHQMTAGDPAIVAKIMAGQHIPYSDLERATSLRLEQPVPKGYTDQASDFDWQFIGPEPPSGRMYHATTDLPGVMEQGLKAGNVGPGLGGPLSGGPGVSVTHSEEAAQSIAGYLKIAAQASKGQATHLQVLESMDSVTKGYLTRATPQEIMQQIQTDAKNGYDIGEYMPEGDGGHLGGEGSRYQGKKFPTAYRNPLTKKFQKVNTMEDLAGFMEQVGLSPLETLKVMDGILLEHSQNLRAADAPMYHWVGPQRSVEEYAKLDPAKIGVVRVAAKSDAQPVLSGVHDELQLLPKDVTPLGAVNPHGIPQPHEMPIVHPEYLKQVTGTSKQLKGIKGVVEQVYTALGSIPIDDLVNSRYFAWVYRREMERRLTGVEQGMLSDGFVARVEEDARKASLTEMRKLMDDFSHKSEFADMVRLIMPFFPAWQETLQRWSGLALENPAFIRRATQVFEAPGKMGLNWKDPTTNEEYVRLRIPEFAKSLLGHGYLGKALDDQGYIRFQSSGLSMAGQGLPGFGPWVDVALHPFVKSHPELIPAMKMVYPFGSAPDSAIAAFIPPTLQRIVAVNDDDAKSMRAAYNRIILTRLTKMSTGELPKLNLDDPGIRSKFLADAHAEAQQLAAMRLVVGMFAPAAIQYDTPYQPFMDKYRALSEADPLTAQEKFLDQYGEDYFHLTQAFTKLNNGVPATLQGDAAYQKYQDMVQRFPELGGLIMGDEGGGSGAQFMASIYQKQRTTPIRPGSDVMMRTPLSPEEIVVQDQARLGWIKFTRAMDLIDSEMAQSGIINLNSKEGESLRIVKDGIVSGLAQQHPAWFQEYSDRNDVKWDNKIAAMGEIAADNRLRNRPDIEMLSEYLQARAMIMGELAVRESSSLDSQSNVDLRLVWDSIVSNMKNGRSGLAFSSLYNRWLIHDPLSSVGFNTLGIDNGITAAA